MKNTFLFIVIILFISSNIVKAQKIAKKIYNSKQFIKIRKPSKLALLKETTFRFPCGDSLGKGYYIAQGYNNFQNHLGVDINGLFGCNTDLGDTIYASSNGIIATSKHTFTKSNIGHFAVFYKYKNKIIKFIYLHCDTVFVEMNNNIKKGTPIGLIGDKGAICAHLHLEVVSDTSIIWNGYGDTTGYINPTTILMSRDRIYNMVHPKNAFVEN